MEHREHREQGAGAGRRGEPARAMSAAFTPKEADDFLTLLEKLVTTFNGAIRTPIVG